MKLPIKLWRINLSVDNLGFPFRIVKETFNKKTGEVHKLHKNSQRLYPKLFRVFFITLLFNKQHVIKYLLIIRYRNKTEIV